MFDRQAPLKRVWCQLRGHRPMRHKRESSKFGKWTICGRCRQLMVRGYYGWQRANPIEEAAFKRLSAPISTDALPTAHHY
jgi:hypothetical protein